MVTINAANNKTGASGKVLQGQGVGTASDFSTATFPSTATGTGTILRADGTNWVATTATYPNTTSANTFLTSTTANTIATDTYIPGTTYTPVLAFGGGSTGITYSTQYGKYQQVGSVVTVKINLVLTSKGSSTGTATITLPITAASDSTTVEMAIGMVSTTLPAGTNYFAVDLASAATTVLLISIGSNAVSALSDTNFANNSQARMCFSYFV